jgi:hypothetical protein
LPLPPHFGQRCGDCLFSLPLVRPLIKLQSLSFSTEVQMYKAGQRQLRISDRVLDIPVSEKTMDAEGIDAARFARSYPHEPQHMRVNGKIAKAGRPE